MNDPSKLTGSDTNGQKDAETVQRIEKLEGEGTWTKRQRKK